MKKIFTLFFAVGMLAVVAQAQPGQRDNRQSDQRGNQQNDQRGYQNQQNDQRGYQQNDQKGYNNGYGDNRQVVVNNTYDRDNRFDDRFSMERRMKMEIARINQEYDFKIEKVRCDFFMRWFEKQRQISFLEQQRQCELRNVYAKFNDRNRFDDRDNHYGRNDRFGGHF
jgi:hypothetical protein